MTIPTHIKKECNELGVKAQAQMDPLCEDHLRQLEHHPTDDEFRNTPIYNEFESLVIEYAESLGYTWDNLDVTPREELRWELQEEFDKSYYSPSDQIQCIGCLEDGDIPMRVDNPDSINADEMLDGKSRSGNTGEGGLDGWR